MINEMLSSDEQIKTWEENAAIAAKELNWDKEKEKLLSIFKKLDKHLNIVAFDNPYPPTYGGVIDVYYKLKSLAETGLKIHLHF